MKPWEVPYSERFKDRLPRVCLAFVAYGDIAPEVFGSALRWALQAGDRYKGRYEIFMPRDGAGTRREQYRARNSLADEARRMGADFILFLDDDHTLSDCPEILDVFFAEEKPLQGGLYVQRRADKIQPVITHYDDVTGMCTWATMDELPAFPGGPVGVLGGGCNWIDVSLLDFMLEPFWWPYPDENRRVNFVPHPIYGLDMHFCIKASRLGVQPWLNRRVQIGHVRTEHEVIYPPGMVSEKVCDHCDETAKWEDDRWVCSGCAEAA